jgi:DNA-binding response OmpR family regulator
MSRILIAEDVPQVSRFLERGLRADGHVTAVAEDGEHALQLAASADFDLLLLDLGLPIRDGHSVLAELRRRRAALPVIVLTARDDPHDVVASFDGGAADYMSKPFGLAELLARIQLRLATTHQRPEAAVLRHGDLALNLRSRVLEIGGDPVALSSREFALAAAF